MNTEKYARGARKTGVATEEFLKMWFVKLPPGSERSTRLKSDVVALLSTFDKQLNKAAAIHVVKNGISI